MAAQYLNAQQVAAYLGLTERTIRKLQKANQIPPPVLIGGIKRWHTDELDRFIKEQSAGEAAGE